MWPDCLPFIVSTGVGGRLFERSGPIEMPALVLWSCVPCLLSALSLCLWCIMLEICLVSRFKGVFSAVCGADVYLYGLRSLRGLCGFCVREWLGGLEACGVFAFLFAFSPLVLSFSPFVLLCPASLLGFLPCLLSCSLSCFLGFVSWLSFPFGRLQTQKERAQILASSRPVVMCYKSLNIILISCGSSFQCRLPLQIIPATSSG